MKIYPLLAAASLMNAIDKDGIGGRPWALGNDTLLVGWGC
jgi:hypothetical protein